ncbi:OLC1v1035902C1 [Oldenlandia corymbosa var. corymbosa]|uniref:OLC1v1035902C1 n=1 Tax=Oldenlandia corymbosa var. corymbosa TaxID=529605 RepID=A0AAV1CU53_OLDCO|nr:OLC1v1035902C1 [Oldenlandia corymbosa var. corymbosa]
MQQWLFGVAQDWNQSFGAANHFLGMNFGEGFARGFGIQKAEELVTESSESWFPNLGENLRVSVQEEVPIEKPRMTMFNGENPRSWLLNCMNYFSAHKDDFRNKMFCDDHESMAMHIASDDAIVDDELGETLDVFNFVATGLIESNYSHDFGLNDTVLGPGGKLSELLIETTPPRYVKSNMTCDVSCTGDLDEGTCVVVSFYDICSLEGKAGFKEGGIVLWQIWEYEIWNEADNVLNCMLKEKFINYRMLCSSGGTTEFRKSKTSGFQSLMQGLQVSGCEGSIVVITIENDMNYIWIIAWYTLEAFIGKREVVVMYLMIVIVKVEVSSIIHLQFVILVISGNRFLDVSTILDRDKLAEVGAVTVNCSLFRITEY